MKDRRSLNAHLAPPNFRRIKPVKTGLIPGFRVRAGLTVVPAVVIKARRGRVGKPWLGTITLGDLTAYAIVPARSMTEAVRKVASLCRGARVTLRMHPVVKPR